MNKICKKCLKEKSIHKFQYINDSYDPKVKLIDRYCDTCGECSTKKALNTKSFNKAFSKKTKIGVQKGWY